MEMGYREYARHRGVTLGAVQKAIKTARISVNANGKIDPAAADQQWRDNTDESRVAVNALEAQVPRVQQEIALPPAAESAADVGRTLPDDEPAAGDGGSSAATAKEYRTHRATRERYQALTQQLEYEQLVGTLISVEEAKRIVYTSFRGLRDSVMNVAARIKDQLAAETDPHACEALIESEISAALAGVDVGKLLQEQDPED
jgi:hypothetical protein